MKSLPISLLINALVFALLMNTTINSQSFDPQSLKDSIDEIVIRKMKQYDIPGLSIGIVSKDSLFYTKGYGVKNIKTRKPVTENSIFHTASISKLFTAQAIINLVQEECLDINDRIIDIVPELRSRNKNIDSLTIKQLLNHTSGLPDVSNYNWGAKNDTDNSLKNYIENLELKIEINEPKTYSYSNLGYDILGYIVQKVTESNFDDYIQQTILNPSGMSNSDFRYFNIPNHLRTSPHSKGVFNNRFVRKTYPYNREHGPSSTLNASAKDLSLWMRSFLRKLNDTSNTVYQSMAKSSFKPYPHIGLGFQLYDIHSQKAIGHYGGDKGFRSFLVLIPNQELGIVLLANCDYEEQFRQEILFEIVSNIIDKKSF